MVYLFVLFKGKIQELWPRLEEVYDGLPEGMAKHERRGDNRGILCKT